MNYLKTLWNKGVGGYQRFRKFELVKNRHWYDGGGSWLTHTIVMAGLHTNLGQYKKAKQCIKWIKEVVSVFHSLPEHIADIVEFEEWKKNEKEVTAWLIKGVKNAEKNIKPWLWEGHKTKVVPWVKSLIWPSAELILWKETLKKVVKC